MIDPTTAVVDSSARNSGAGMDQETIKAIRMTMTTMIIVMVMRKTQMQLTIEKRTWKGWVERMMTTTMMKRYPVMTRILPQLEPSLLTWRLTSRSTILS